LNICVDIQGKEKSLINELNVDLIIARDLQTGAYILYGKSSSVLLSKLTTMVKDKSNIRVVKIKEDKKND
jgi:hypothetical protein